MGKKKDVQKPAEAQPAAPATEEAATAPDAMVPATPANMAGIPPTPRLRGSGPLCPRCRSGMICNGIVPGHGGRTHPFVPMRYYKCKNDACGYTCKR